jgi:hypothetical protein
MKIKNNLVRSAELHYTLSILRGSEIIDERKKSKNLILDCGLDSVANSNFPSKITYMLLGNAVNPTPVRRDSGVITLSQSGVTITASGNYFVASDTGRLLKYNDGTGAEVYLTYVSPTQATASRSVGISSVNGTIWYVNQTALDSFVRAGNSAGAGGGDNGTTWVGSVQTLKKTILCGAESGRVTYTEIGFNESSSNTNIFDRDIIVGGITLDDGDQARCMVELIVTYAPTTPLAVANVGTNCDTSGNMQIEGYAMFAFINTSGNVQAGGIENDRLGTGYWSGSSVSLSSVTLQTFGSSLPNRTVYDSPCYARSYTNGNFYRDYTMDLDTSEAIGTLYAVILGSRLDFAGMQNSGCAVTLVFTTPFTKSSIQTFQTVWRMSWNRTLIN